MRAAIYNPYWDSLGGGERYTISFARVLVENGYTVDLQWDDEGLLQQIKERFNIDSAGVKIVSDIKRGDGYDLCFWVSDGSIPLLRSRKNIIHFQFPFKDVNGSSLYNRTKMFRIKHVVVNSNFTKRFIDEEYKVKSEVVYPPVDVKSFRPGKKENLILYVGRFSQLTQKKNQHILIKAFKRIKKLGVEDYQLILAGGLGVGTDKKYYSQLKKEARGLDIKFVENPSFNELKTLYKKAKFFWNASGLGVDEDQNPLKVEHFGITTVEAMAAGCVVFAPNNGGTKEIIESGVNGYLWEKLAHLVTDTIGVIKNSELTRSIIKSAVKDAQKYSYEKFNEKVESLL